MYNSIIEFIKNDTTKIEKITKEFLLAGNTLRFEENLMEAMVELGRNIYQECLENVEQSIRKSDARKKEYCVEHKADRRILLTIFGNIEIERAYYKPKNGGKSVYLLDQYLGIEPHDKVSLRALTRNGCKIIDLMEFQDEKQRKERRIEIQEKLIKQVQKNEMGNGFLEGFCSRQYLMSTKYEFSTATRSNQAKACPKENIFHREDAFMIK